MVCSVQSPQFLLYSVVVLIDLVLEGWLPMLHVDDCSFLFSLAMQNVKSLSSWCGKLDSSRGVSHFSPVGPVHSSKSLLWGARD